MAASGPGRRAKLAQTLARRLAGRRGAQFRQDFRLDLTDALARQPEGPADPPQGLGPASISRIAAR